MTNENSKPNGVGELMLKNIEDYRPILEKVFHQIIHNYAFDSQDVLLDISQKKEKVITIMNHSTPLSWLPAACVMAEQFCRAGGGSRVPIAVMHKFFFDFPLLKPLGKYFTQFNQVLSFDEVLKKFQANECTDLAIFPEGSNCFFGEGHVVQPFRSPRFVEIALRAKAPILLAAHHGSENWAKSLRIQREKIPFMAYLPGWVNEKIERGGHFTLPLWPRPIEDFRMKCEIYEPELKLEDLSGHRRERLDQLWQEAERVRHRMQEMVDSLAS